MKKLLIISIFTILISCICKEIRSQEVKGSGQIKTDIREIKNFKNLVLQGDFDVILVQGEVEGVRISADENLLTLFQTRRAEETLFITMIADIKKSNDLKVIVSFKELQNITLLNNVTIKTNQVIHFDELSLFSSGNANIDVDIYCTKLNLTMVDRSIAHFKGFAQDLNLDIHDETELDAFDLQTENSAVVATGYSEVMIRCEKSISLKVTGESNVYYMGEPQIANRVFSSNGFIVKRKKTDLPK